MEGPEGVILTLRDWIEATSELLATQSSLEQLGPSEVLAIVDQLRTAIFNIGSLEAIDAASAALGVLLEVTGDMSDNQDELLELIQGMLNGIIEPAEEEDFDEFDQLGLRICQLVERSGEGDFVLPLLDGAAGHLLELIARVEVASEVRDGFLVAMNRLVSNCPPAVGERLGEEYASDLAPCAEIDKKKCAGHRSTPIYEQSSAPPLKAPRGLQGGPLQSESIHSSLDIFKGSGHQKSESVFREFILRLELLSANYITTHLKLLSYSFECL